MEKQLKNKGIVLFDGYCNLCSWSVQFIIKRDKNDYFRFVPLQSEIGKNLLDKFKLPVNFENSVILIENENIYFKSDAALRIVKNLNKYWKHLYYFIYIPKFIRDFLYDIIAKSRFKWFGKHTDCYLPSNEEKEKFL